MTPPRLRTGYDITADGRVKHECLLVAEDLERAQMEFHPFASPHEGWAVIREEVDELWELVKADNGRSPKALKEARQVAAMAVRYIIDLEMER